MNNQTDPACRDDFIAAMEVKGHDLDLTWQEGDDEGPWWDDAHTNDAFNGFCAAWQPPRDVDPESVLGKLHEMARHTSKLPLPRTIEDGVSVMDIIDTIESLQRKAESLASEGKTNAASPG